MQDQKPPPTEKKSQKTLKNGTSSASSDEDSDIEPDLVSAINYNTISSLSALKDMLNQSEESSFFQSYFRNHATNLPSRNAVNCRRLSQCREEDEEEDKKDLIKEPVPSSSNISTISGSDKSLSESSSGSKTSVIDTVSGPTHKFVITKTKQPRDLCKNIVRNYHPANTVNYPPTDPKKPSVYSIFRSPLQSPHYDHRFFDSSLIEMKSQTSSSSTLECGSAEDIWVKRADLKRVSRSIDCYTSQ